jgi:hypothetical protein
MNGRLWKDSYTTNLKNVSYENTESFKPKMIHEFYISLALIILFFLEVCTSNQFKGSVQRKLR